MRFDGKIDSKQVGGLLFAYGPGMRYDGHGFIWTLNFRPVFIIAAGEEAGHGGERPFDRGVFRYELAGEAG